MSNIKQAYTLEDQAVFALTQIMRVYLRKHEFKTQDMFRKDGDNRTWSLGEIGERDEMAVEQGVSPRTLDLLEHPVPAALKQAMTAIGETLFGHAGSTELMSVVLRRVGAAFPEEEERVFGILDKAFDGIGTWSA